MKTHNVITDNCEKIRPEYQTATVRFDYTKASKAAVTAKDNVRIESSARNVHRPPWHKLKDDEGDDATDAQLQQWRRGPLGSDTMITMFEVVEISDACFVHLLLQYAPHAVVHRI